MFIPGNNVIQEFAYLYIYIGRNHMCVTIGEALSQDILALIRL